MPGSPGATANYSGATVCNAATIGGAGALATSSISFVAVGVDVIAPDSTRAIVAFGDSITDGANTVTDTNTRWSDFLAARFDSRSRTDAKPRVAVFNAGISGNKVATDNATLGFGIAGVTRFKRDVLDRSGVTDVIVLEGINDIGQAATPTPSDVVIAAYRDLIRQAHAANVKIYFATITPIRTDVATSAGTYGGLFSATAALFDLREPVRQTVNAWILSQKEADDEFDFNAAVSAPGRLNQMLAANSVSLTNSASNDQLHPNAIGYQVIGDREYGPPGSLSADFGVPLTRSRERQATDAVMFRGIRGRRLRARPLHAAVGHPLASGRRPSRDRPCYEASARGAPPRSAWVRRHRRRTLAGASARRSRAPCRWSSMLPHVPSPIFRESFPYLLFDAKKKAGTLLRTGFDDQRRFFTCD